MPEIAIRRTAAGRAFLNAGCGSTYSEEWNNIDLSKRLNVVCHDLRKPLPYPDGVFDAVYSSHALEHLSPEDGRRLASEMYRCLKFGGVCRIVVPDFERACREYLSRLNAVLERPDERNLRRYRWSVLELIDQFVRERSGGKMLETLQSGDFDEEYVRERNGEEFAMFFGCSPAISTKRPGYDDPLPTAVRKVRRWFKSWLGLTKGPMDTGELHRWAYDRFSLRLLMEEAGFAEVAVRDFRRSLIPDWEKYLLDSGADGRPRKPDSLFMEGKKLV